MMNAAAPFKVSTRPPARPFVKWAGGKSALVGQILAGLPSFNRYFEPFLGGGAVFFKLAPPSALLSDANPKLINAYQALQFDPDAVISRLLDYKNTKEFYLSIREKNFEVGSAAERAADFIYCLRVNFNGLYRENKSGKYNVPFGDNPNAVLCDVDNLIAVAHALQGIEIAVADFAAAVAPARAGDFVYFDPPYEGVSPTSSFSSYVARGFTFRDQVRLRDLALSLKARGVHVIVSNSSAPSILELYKDFEITLVDARRSINSKADRRGPVKDVLIR